MDQGLEAKAYALNISRGYGAYGSEGVIPQEQESGDGVQHSGKHKLMATSLLPLFPGLTVCEFWSRFCEA